MGGPVLAGDTGQNGLNKISEQLSLIQLNEIFFLKTVVCNTLLTGIRARPNRNNVAVRHIDREVPETGSSVMETLKKEGMTLTNRKLPVRVNHLKLDEFSTEEQIKR